MESAMTADLQISLAPEQLDEGSFEEQAGFGLFAIQAGSQTLTEGYDVFVGALRQGPLVSGYHAAEWFAWNWWRLLHEPKLERGAQSQSWWRAHRMTAIGEGYVWPNITIHSDGVRSVITSDRSAAPDAKPFRYLGAHPWMGPSRALADAIDAFVPQILGRLRECGLRETNLNRIWAELLAERANPAMSEHRRLEALLGRDPDEVDDDVIAALQADRAAIGAAAVDELAAGSSGATPPRADELNALAYRFGTEAQRADAVRLEPAELRGARRYPLAWQQGRHAAQALRSHLRFETPLVITSKLHALLGMSADMDRQPSSPLSMSFLLDQRGAASRVVLRSHWETGRRFELARLLGDHLLFGKADKLLPATRAYTFRQQAQRSFAAEFLSPLDAVLDVLQQDFSQESIEEAANRFEVSPQTIETLLLNNDLLERDTVPDAA
jgi:hypothetical protein